jgi:hypothetical protein
MLDSPKEFTRQTQVWERGNWLAKTQVVAPDTCDIWWIT